MGRNSTKQITCRVKLSVTNAFLEKIKDAVRKADFDGIIRSKTWDCASVVREEWRDDGGVLGGIRNGLGVFSNFIPGVNAVVNMSWTDVYITYTLKVDMYHLIRNKTNRVIAQVLKRLPPIRRRLIYKEMQREIKKGFKDKISQKAGFFSGVSGLAVVVKSVKVTTF
tara:strand:+ start:790 stop:1290 length:501 start_codon:yes stop_codon:yes gene_type:complete